MTAQHARQRLDMSGRVVQCRTVAQLAAAMGPVQTGVADGDFLQRLRAVGGEARRDDVDITQLRPLRRETAPDLRPGGRNEQMARTIANAIRQELLRLNSEFANYVPAQHQMPQVTLAPAGDPKYFPGGVKHRYTRK
jgi:hypothetical protein